MSDDPRRVAIDALVRIDEQGAYANLLVPTLLGRASLEARDRGFVTELVYGTTRMRRACDWLVDRFVHRALDPPVRAALRIGAYQLACLGTPAHAAVAATVTASPTRARGLVNAVLRKVATAPTDWPDAATRLSYPDWMLARLGADVGPDAALAALEAMNRPAEVVPRPDGYVQDRASQWVAELVEAAGGQRVADLCAAPGGKASAIAWTGAWVAALDRRRSRVRLLAGNLAQLGVEQVRPVVGDGRRPPLRPGSFERVLVDAPCSGLGTLGRHADARWRIEESAVDRLAGLQVALLDAAAGLVAPGGLVVYSVCTLTDAEGAGVDRHVAAAHRGLDPLDPPGPPWVPYGRGARLLPQAAGTDGMTLFRYRRRP